VASFSTATTLLLLMAVGLFAGLWVIEKVRVRLAFVMWGVEKCISVVCV
jgi:hypothetical protein